MQQLFVQAMSLSILSNPKLRPICAILGVDYDALRKKRQSQQSENLRYFLAELLKISEIRQLIQELLNKA